jgi:hypothetical protein
LRGLGDVEDLECQLIEALGVEAYESALRIGRQLDNQALARLAAVVAAACTGSS